MSSSMVAVCPETENIGLLEDKVPMFCLESTEVCLKEVRCFWVSEASPPKKVSEKNLHFLHQTKKIPIKPELFWCRIGCRILLSLESYPTPPAPFCLISRVNREKQRFAYQPPCV